MNDISEVVGIIITSLLIVAIIVLIPIVVILSLNELFSLGIEITFYTWLSVVVLLGVFVGGSR